MAHTQTPTELASDCGGNAFFDGRPLSDNPWGCFVHTKEHHAWNSGWNAARADSQRNSAEIDATASRNAHLNLAHL